MSKNTLLSELINYISANASGNVVIAAPSSGYALDVTGTGRFTGALTGTSATFSTGLVVSNVSDVYPEFKTSAIDADAFLGFSNTGDGNAAWSIGRRNTGEFWISTYTGNFNSGTRTQPLIITTSGAATFSSSVTATQMYLPSNAGSSGFLQFNYSSANASSRSWRIYNDTVAYGDLSIAQSTTQTGSSYNYLVTINPSGRVSIGTTATHGNLTVEQTSGESGVTINSSIAQSPKLYLRDAGGAGYSEIVANNKLYINASNVGIGTTAPDRDPSGTRSLAISGGGSLAASLDLYGNGRNFAIFTGGAGALGFFDLTAGSERMRITSGGNVLIGTTTDISYRVNVSGSVYLSNVLSIGSYFEGNCNFSSYTNDGLFSANARPSTITTPSGSQRIKLGYFDYGGGQYYGRIGFAANTNWSLGTIGSAGNDFGIGTGASGQILTITSAGNIGMGVNSPSNKLQVSGNIYSTDTVFARNLKPEAFVSVNAGTPSGAGIPLGYSSMNISTITDGNWRSLLSNINDVKGYFWVTLGDAASKDTANYFMAMTSPAYGVSNFGAVSYQDNGWNTGGFEFTTDTVGGTYRLLVRCTSYYSGGNTAYGTIYFLRME